jgi:hypothetical protein
MSHVIERPPQQPLVPPGGVEPLAADMTAIFSADCTLRRAQDTLAEHGQWLPVDGDPDATLGSLVESNSTGPLRLGYGGWRDLLLGTQFTNGKGELITAGGRTVKNVAGYDLTKFMVGNFGIFGRVVTLTTRTYRQPGAALTVRADGDAAAVGKLLSTPCRPQWSLLTDEGLILGYLGDQATVDYYEAAIQQYQPSPLLSVKPERLSVSEQHALRTGLWSAQAGEDGIRFRASLPPARFREFNQNLLLEASAFDPAFGILVGECLQQDLLRAEVHRLGGSIRFGCSADDLDISTNPNERQIIERLKVAFDPDNRLQPLPWQRR